MRTTTRALAALAFAALALPAAALGKGAESATVNGPGLDRPLELTGLGEPGSVGTLGRVAERAGFFAAVFDQSPNPMLDARPSGELGPRYTIAYVLPGPSGTRSTIRQDVYPYAAPRPLSYTPPGQRFWAGQTTRGGWFVADASLKAVLVEAGLPRSAPAPAGDTSSRLDSPPWWLLGMAAALLAAGAAALLLLRRRPHTASAH